MNSPHDPWQRLIAAAQAAPLPAEETGAPLGFATRVAALATAQKPEPTVWGLLDLLSLRISMVAISLTILLLFASGTFQTDWTQPLLDLHSLSYTFPL